MATDILKKLHILLLISFFTCGASNSKIPTLNQLCIRAIVKDKLLCRQIIHDEEFPCLVKEEIIEKQKQLDEALQQCLLHPLHSVNEIEKLIADGANPHQDHYPLNGVASINHNMYRVFYANSEIRKRLSRVIYSLKKAGVSCSPELLFNAVDNNNKEGFELLLAYYFPKKVTKSVPIVSDPQRFRMYEESADEDLWKGYTLADGFTLFHYAARYTQRADFLEDLFINHAKWKYLLDDNNGERRNVLSILAADQANQTKQRLIKHYERERDRYLFTPQVTEGMTDSSIKALEWFRNTEPISNFLYNVFGL